MKILHVIRGLENSSGTTHVVGPLTEEQAKLGHEISVFFVEKTSSPPALPDPALVRSAKFPVTLANGHPGVSLPFARRMSAAVGCFDVVHVHAIWNFPTFYAMRAANRARVPYMVAPQGSLEPWAIAAGSWHRRLYARHIEKPLIDRAARLQALTPMEEAQFRAFGLSAPAAIIPNGVQPDWLSSPRVRLPAKLELPADSKVLLFLSRLHKKKGLDILLKGFARFARERADVVLIIAGDDAGSGYGEELRSLARSLAVDDKCRFVGEVRGAEKARLFAGADAFALTSHSEGLPVAVIEAMASRLPVLATARCNLPQIAAADAGLLVAAEPDTVADALLELFADEDRMRAQGCNGRRLVAEHFTWPAIARQTIAVYEEMIADTRSRRVV